MTQKSDRSISQLECPGRQSSYGWLAAYRETLTRNHTRYLCIEGRWSWIRLATFVAGIFVVVLLRHDPLLAAIATVPFLVGFFGAVLRHTAWKDKCEFVERVLVIVKESLHASTECGHPVRTWKRPENPADVSTSLPVIIESGPIWPLADQEQDDLDMYRPPVGIFGLLNRTSTDLGARCLRDIMNSPCLSQEHIRRRQRMIRWLDLHNEQRVHIMASALLLRRQSGHLDSLVQLLHQTRCNPRTTLSRCIRMWSLFSGLFSAYAILRIANGQFEWVIPFAILILLNCFIRRVGRAMLNMLRASVSSWINLAYTLRCFLVHAQCASCNLPDETPLGILKDCFQKVLIHSRIPSLCSWLGWVSLGGIIYNLLNTLVFFDLHVAEGVLARIIPNHGILLRGLSAMAELEAYNSLACFSAEQPVACYPRLASETMLSVKNGRHPLISDNEITPNSVQLTLDKQMWVVTGPNATGKSTFLRMVGINVLLAQIGAAATAEDMIWSPVRLITDIRIHDDIAKHESYFLSEVRRLRRMVLESNNSTPLLGLIDEPFRGTNYQERIAAGVALLEHLLVSSNLFLVATHEEELVQTAADSSSAENYYFQEHLQDSGIMFDYHLRLGSANTKTALRILEQEGYPESLVERARALMAL